MDFFGFFCRILGIPKIAPGAKYRRRYLFAQRKELGFTF